jgi:RHS repeat-associated protein
MLVEIDASGEADAVLRQNTWGLDLAGQNGGGIAYAAGGIGGLLAVHDTRGTAPTGDDLDGVFTYDANGNVGQVVDLTATTWSSAAITAHYEYTPYGGVTNTISGYAYAEENPWRFSTKQWDPETALGYWGRRYYSATLGRWLNEDPIEERGGANLYAYVQNRPLRATDARGLIPVPCTTPPCGDDPAIAPYQGGAMGGQTPTSQSTSRPTQLTAEPEVNCAEQLVDNLAFCRLEKALCRERASEECAIACEFWEGPCPDAADVRPCTDYCLLHADVDCIDMHNRCWDQAIVIYDTCRAGGNTAGEHPDPFDFPRIRMPGQHSPRPPIPMDP